MNRLFRLLNSNRGRGSPVKAEVVDGVATLYLYDAVVATETEAQWWGGVAADTLVKQIMTLDAQTIALRINSPGGDVFAARAIATALREHSAQVQVTVDGVAASAASIIAMAGDTVAMADGAMMMIHNAWTIAIGNAADMTATATLLDKIDGTIAETYANKSGGDAAKFRDLMAAETWLTAAEAINLGLADSQVTTDAKKNAAKWDLSAYERAPAARAEEPETPPAPEPAANAARADRERLQRYLELVGN